jgi:hypothetical protein
VDVDLAQVSLAHLLARRADDVEPVTASGQRSAHRWVKNRAPASSQRGVPKAHHMLRGRALELAQKAQKLDELFNHIEGVA